MANERVERSLTRRSARRANWTSLRVAIHTVHCYGLYIAWWSYRLGPRSSFRTSNRAGSFHPDKSIQLLRRAVDFSWVT